MRSSPASGAGGAAQMAKLHDVPVVVREMGDSESLEIAIIENVQRADLNAIEEAAAYYDLMERFQYTQDRVAKEVGKSRPHIANTLRLLTLPESVRAMVRDGRLSAGHARTLIGSPDAETRALQIVSRFAQRSGRPNSVQRPRNHPKTAPDLWIRISPIWNPGFPMPWG